MTKRPSLTYEKALKEDKKAVICKLKGKLIGGHETYDFLEDTRGEISDGMTHVILDLTGLSLVNSTGVGILAALFTSTRNKDGRLIIVGVDDNLKRILEVVHIWSMLEPAGSVEEALAAL